MKLYQCSVLHITSVYIATRPWFLLTRSGPWSSDIFRYPLREKLCSAYTDLFYYTQHYVEQKNKLYSFINEQMRDDKKWHFFYCLLIMHFDLACDMWCVHLQWRRKQSEGDKTTQRCFARCLWTVFFFVILKGTVQWIVHIEECLSYICQCSFYIILWSIKVDWWKFINCKELSHFLCFEEFWKNKVRY